MSTYHHGDLRSALLQAGAELLEEQGLASLSIRETARRAGVSHNAPYRHFPDRDALLAALAAEGFGMLEEALAAKGTRESGEAYVRFALGHPNRFRLMFGAHVKVEKHAELRAAARRTYEGLVAGFTGRPEIADPEKAAAAAWCLVHGLAQLLLDGHFPAREREEFVRSILGTVRFVQRSA